ncbi:MAG: HAMP domain-containing histidine kinase [Acidimicrobiia bacterium]|nr:HAMP domain-containing histidine kinase [Acidimicrobiia bacterium]
MTTRRSRLDRVLGITVLTGLSLALVIGVVFAIAYGSRNITSNATDLHKADESLRSATVARAQITLAAYMASVDEAFGTVTVEPRLLSQNEATTALSDLETGILELEANEIARDTRVGDTADRFTITGREVLAALDAGNVVSARSVLDDAFDTTFRDLVEDLVTIRDQLANHIEESDALLGRIGDLARFLVAFFIPAAIILIYRELARRRQKETELEQRLESERRLTRYREEFIANASHELRTPLTGIVGMSMILEEDPAVQQAPMLNELVHTITSEANDLSRMVEDLLTTARLDAGALQYTFENVQVSGEVETTAASLIRGGLNVTIDCEPGVVRADRTRLRQVVRNLLSNASKYGGPQVRVTGRAAGTTYIISVADDGEGLPPEVQDRLFERFVHADQRAGTIDSVGLGLSIVQALVSGMGGAVSHQRVAGQTRFDVRMPLADPAGGVAAAELDRSIPAGSAEVGARGAIQLGSDRGAA